MCWIVDLCCCWTQSASRGCSLQQLERQCRKKKERWAPSACSRRKVTRRLKSELPLRKSHPARGLLSLCAWMTLISLSRLPSTYKWSCWCEIVWEAFDNNFPFLICDPFVSDSEWGRNLKPLKRDLANVVSSPLWEEGAHAGGRGIFNNSVLESESRRVFVLRVCKWFVLGPQIQDLEAWYSLRSVAVAMTAQLNTAASVLGKRKKNKQKNPQKTAASGIQGAPENNRGDD